MIATLQPPALAHALRWAELAELMGRCERALRDELARYATPLGLSQAQFSLLWACRHAPPEGLSQNELATELALSPAHVSGQVEQLRAKGWLEGQRRAPDRRKQVWRLTSEGDAQLEIVLAALIEWAGQIEEQMPAPRRQALTSLLAELSSALALCQSVVAGSSLPPDRSHA